MVRVMRGIQKYTPKSNLEEREKPRLFPRSNTLTKYFDDFFSSFKNFSIDLNLAINHITKPICKKKISAL